ncbi:hypothetical protein ACLQ24_22585 [Micromonospora sp. DT4]
MPPLKRDIGTGDVAATRAGAYAAWAGFPPTLTMPDTDSFNIKVVR